MTLPTILKVRPVMTSQQPKRKRMVDGWRGTRERELGAMMFFQRLHGNTVLHPNSSSPLSFHFFYLALVFC